MHINNFQEFIISLSQYWVDHGCILSQPYDAQMGAGTFHPHTFLKGIGPEPWRSVYVQPCRRPVDGRYGKSPYRFQHYYQLQVLLKPSPSNILDIFLKSLEHVGICLKDNDIGLLEDDWKGPTLGAWGLGWEVRANGQEVTQFTYFQQLGGLDIDVVCGEITYGLERLFMYAKGYKNALDIPFNEHFTYGDIFYQNEYEFSFFNFKEANLKELFAHFERCESHVSKLCEKSLVLPAYDYVLQASHSFNLLDARGAISSSERQRYIGRVRDCAKKCASQYKAEREKLGYPMLNRLECDARHPIISKHTAPIINIYSKEEQFYTNIEQFKNKEKLNLLFELGVEEMPPSFQTNAIEELNNKLSNFFNKETEKFKDHPEFLIQLNDIKTSINISSRRISIEFLNTPKQEPMQKIKLWGPAERIAKSMDGSLTQAGIGFCKKNQIDPQQCYFKIKTDGCFLYFEKEQIGKDLPTLLAAEFKDWCINLSAALKMKWLPQEISPSFIRPVRWVLALVEDKVIELDLFGLKSSRYTCGQRILSPEFVAVQNVSNYCSIMESKFVNIHREKRRELILNEMNMLCEKVHGSFIPDDSLVEKCVGLFENPKVFIAEFEEKYLRLPRQLITSVLKEHMHYFSVSNKSNNDLLPYYIGVANYNCNNINNMIEGTKTVVTGRLEDGAFYYDEDLTTPLPEFKDRLKNQLFQEGMGTLFDKSERLKSLAFSLSNLIECNIEDISKEQFNLLASTAGEFSKADLKTGCVQEFPDDMQGVMGALLVEKQNILSEQNLSNIVSQAICEHYLPTGANSPLAKTQLGCLLSIADKIDSLSLLINHGIEIKANKDPLGLRRLALSIARLLGLKNEAGSLHITLNELIQQSLINIASHGIKVTEHAKEKIESFIVDRIKVTLKEEFDPQSIEALTKQISKRPIADIRQFASSITQALTVTGSSSLLNALIPYRRARNLTQDLKSPISIHTKLFKEPAELTLFEKLIAIEKQVHLNFENHNYEIFLSELSSLTEPLATFFESVMVNDPKPEIKENRLALLLRIRVLYENFADFSLIQVQ